MSLLAAHLPRAPRCCRRLAAAFLAAAAAAAAQDKSPDDVIRPAAAPRAEAPAAPGRPGGLGAATLLGALGLAAGGAWLFRRGRLAPPGGREHRRLAVEETRPLGNRQYLVVASYEDRRFLLGVCPGRIELLAPLEREAARRDPPAP